MSEPGELAKGERIKVIRVSIDIETTMRHPAPATFEWQGRIGDDFWEVMERNIIKAVLEMFSKE